MYVTGSKQSGSRIYRHGDIVHDVTDEQWAYALSFDPPLLELIDVGEVISPEPTEDPPLAGYDAMTVGQVLVRLDKSDPWRVREVIAYERENKARKGLLAKLDALAQELEGGG